MSPAQSDTRLRPGVVRRKLALEQEIQQLRGSMEKAVGKSNSFTSEAVIAASRLLDAKINEYNAFMLEQVRFSR